MIKKVVIFNELTARIKTIIEFFQSVDAQMYYSVDGKDSYELIQENNPAVAILGVAMPGLSGIEISRRIKLDEERKDIKVVLVSDIPGESIKTRALEAGCDLYLTAKTLTDELYLYAQNLFKVPPRAGFRVKIEKEAQILAGDKKILGRTLNLSQSGLLVSSPENLEIGTNVKIVINGDGGDIPQLELEGIVARFIELPKDSEFENGLGIKFTTMGEAAIAGLSSYIKTAEETQEGKLTGKKVPLKPLIDFFLAEDEFFAELLGNLMKGELGEAEVFAGMLPSINESEERFEFKMPKLQTWEITAFAGGNEEQEVYLGVIRKLVMLNAKFENMQRVADDIPFCDPDEERTLLNVLESSLELGKSTENEASQILSSDIGRIPGLAGQIKRTLGKYMDSKGRLLKPLVEKYELLMDKKQHFRDTIKVFSETLGEIKSRMAEKKEEISKSQAKRETTKEKAAKEKAGVSKGFAVKGKSSKVLVLVLAALVLVVLTVVAYSVIFTGRVDVSKYSEPGFLAKGKLVEDTLNVICEDSWNTSRDKRITKVALQKLAGKVRQDNMCKVKLIDSKGKLLGVIMCTPDKRSHEIMVF